ncbi:hypothetical protein T459_35291 [Capsicum annuum]|uniref:F-box domain-containing protein n=1 Tax=Capsicum annuum TaxID=4072 RepID=A0A2G2XTN6_CAPAN|nr:hypothetical protein T459_35291 [Capsicum annuum]
MDVDGTKEVHLQEEIIMDILSRLPVLSLLRFKCVSKCWMTLISEPYFTLKHLNRAKNNEHSQKILVLHGEFPLHCSSLSTASLSSVQLAEDVRKLDWPSNPRPWRFRMYCCYDGLVLIKLRDYPQYARARLLLWNPSTRESTVLPRTEFSLTKDYSFGLGYDSTSDDYKILKIDDAARCEILALKSGSWRKIDTRPAGVFPVLSDTEDSLAFVHDGEVLLRCRDLECGSVFKTSKESSRLWPQSVSEPIQDGFVYTETGPNIMVIQTFEEVPKLDCPSNAELWRCFLYCCYDSLALIGVYNYRDHTHQLWLWNPSTRESIVLPGPKFPPELFCTWGLGYDSVSDDYKILKIDLKSRSEILTLKSGSWRLTNKYPTDILPALFCTDSLVFVHGAFHWIDEITRFMVSALSISSEVYTEIPLPEQMLSIYNQTWGV